MTEQSGPPPESVGIITRYLAGKAFGFIARHGEPDVFFHASDLVDPALRVEIGQRVAFRLEPGRKKPRTFIAVNVRRIGRGSNSERTHDDGG